MADLTLVTATGDRPQAFALCERWMGRQTFTGSTEWIVVDDGAIPTTPTMGQRYVRREPTDGDPPHTLPLNLLAAMEAGIGSDRLLFIEDDDWYSPGYLAWMHATLDTCDLFGEGLARYYNLRGGLYRRMSNDRHASLAQTGITRGLYEPLRDMIAAKIKEPFIDLRLWAACESIGRIYLDPWDTRRMHCSIKGLPGRIGTGVGHDQGWAGWHHDKGGQWLRRWVGDDAGLYQ